uniref:Uncharacterized protein n=1 Tax=Amphimedon queenslandica TaxID=400682 RepID=A0A1X7TW60_AMPQE
MKMWHETVGNVFLENKVFRDTYSQHRLRTENNMCPLQLWISGMAMLHDDTENDFFPFDTHYGVDWDGPAVLDNEDITVPPENCPLSEEQLALLKQSVDPLQDCEDYGVPLYVAVRNFVYAAIA